MEPKIQIHLTTPNRDINIFRTVKSLPGTDAQTRKCMLCLAPDITAGEAIATSVGFTALYVSSLYLPFNTGDRNHRAIILSRLLTLSILSFGLEIYTRRRVPALSHKDLSYGARLPALTVAALLTLLLYTGHLAATPPHQLASYSFADTRHRYVALRNYLAGPVLEEIVFRRQTLLIWSCQGDISSLLFPAAMFSLAHVHHVRELGTIGVLFQMAYTFLFGVYAAALYMNTQTFWAPFVAHVICNVLEVPDFAAIASHPRKKVLILLYCCSLVLFAVAFGPLTTLVRPYQLATE